MSWMILEKGWPKSLCMCDCGVVDLVFTQSINNGRSKSCGCKQYNNHITHGYNGTRTYKSYHSMKERCLNPNHHAYNNYGGRGIKICDRWLLSFENFLEDMGERPIERTLDRVNNDGDYMKDNCRWATNIEQANNRRKRAIVLVKQ